MFVTNDSMMKYLRFWQAVQERHLEDQLSQTTASCCSTGTVGLHWPSSESAIRNPVNHLAYCNSNYRYLSLHRLHIKSYYFTLLYVKYMQYPLLKTIRAAVIKKINTTYEQFEER